MSLFAILPWWSWLAGMLGIVGAIAALLLAPTLAIEFIKTALGRFIIGVVCAFYIGSAITGAHVRAECQAREEKAEARAKQRDDKQAEHAAGDEDKRAALLEAALKKAKEELDEWKRKAAQGGACPLKPDDLPRGG